jgi:PAS domain S-box-containing protein
MKTTPDLRDEALLRRLPVLLTLMDRDGRFVDVTDDWERRTGYSREDMRGLRPEDIATPASAERIREEHLPRFRRTGRLDHVPVQFFAKDGRPLDFMATTVAVYAADGGEFRYSVSLFEEPSDRDRLERRYLDLYESTPAMLHTVDADGRITAVSNHWLGKLGYQRNEVIGRSILEFIADASREPLMGGRLQEVISQGNLQNVPRQMVTKGGEVLDVLLSARAERDDKGRVVRLLVASKDVTERNRAEARLREAYGEIARLKEELERERDYLREEVNVSMNFGRIVGSSPSLASMLARIEAVAGTPASVLIVGETGSGKELVAHAIHARSRRANGPLVKVNCAAIPDELFESEFFGHVRGAFTGAHRDRIGRFELADGGTIFLDEVGEIPLSLQGKLLRVLQEKEFERVGDDKTRKVDVRVIAATNKDLETAVEAGEFREDLYYRLGVFPVQVPPLRKRGDDVVQLAEHFLEQVCRQFARRVPRMTEEQKQTLRRYDWPGNVRELKNVIERAVILSRGEVLRLDLSLSEAARSDVPVAPPPAVSASPTVLTDAQMREQQRLNVLAALQAANWRISGPGGAAGILGLKPTTLADRMRALGLERPPRKAAGRARRASSP